MNDMRGLEFLSLAAGIPAILGWLAYGLCWLINPRLAAEQDPLIWAAYAAGGWYAFWVMILGGSSMGGL